MKKTKRHNVVSKGKETKPCYNDVKPVPFEIDGFKGLKCSECYEVLEYTSTSKASEPYVSKHIEDERRNRYRNMEYCRRH